MTRPATERAADVLREAIDTWRMAYDADDLHYPTMPDTLVAALMADPDLLVDLAIEAGGLVMGFSNDPDYADGYYRRSTR